MQLAEEIDDVRGREPREHVGELGIGSEGEHLALGLAAELAERARGQPQFEQHPEQRLLFARGQQGEELGDVGRVEAKEETLRLTLPRVAQETQQEALALTTREGLGGRNGGSGHGADDKLSRPAMIQELFRIGPLAISPFGVMMVIAFTLAYLELRRNLVRTGAGNDDDASSLVFAAGLAGIIGAKVYYAILYRDARLLLERSGLVWYGGFLAGVVAVLWVARRRRLSLPRLVDAMAPALALGYGLGRIGCFLVGDDYGRPTDLPWGITYPNGLPPTTAGFLRSEFGIELPASVPDSALLAVHPTQLYELAAGVAIWLVGRRLLGRLRAGEAGLWVLSLLSLERFLIEFVRAKDDRILGSFTVAQAVAVGVLALCLLLIARLRRRPRPAP